MYDVFISYASEDKEAIAYPLAEELKRNGYRVWFDEFSMSVGDSLRRSIDKGMVKSKFGIVIFSKSFFRKGWTNYELDGLVEMNINAPGTLLPIWLNVSKKEVAEYSRSLSNILAIDGTNLSPAEIVQRLTSKLGEYYYYIDENEKLVCSASKVNISLADREAGSQIIKSINTDQIIDQETCICTNDALVYPYGDMSEYHFNYWQGRKGELNVITHMAYDYNTGKLISTGNTVELNDGNRLLSVVHFKRISDGPIRIVCKISATNLHFGLFKDGFTDMGFNHGADIEYFAYYFMIPIRTGLKQQIKAFADDEECEIKRLPNRFEMEHVIRNVKAGDTTNYRFLNEVLV